MARSRIGRESTIVSDDIERANAEHLMAAFAVVLTHPAGFNIEVSNDLRIGRLVDGRFRVYRFGILGKIHSEEIFDDVRSAIDYYLDLRDELKLGADFET